MAILRPIKTISVAPSLLQVLKSMVTGGKDLVEYDESNIYNVGDLTYIRDVNTGDFLIYKAIRRTSGPFNMEDWSSKTTNIAVAWEEILMRPTTIDEFGISDAVHQNQFDQLSSQVQQASDSLSGWNYYNTLFDLGITSGTETVDSIVKAMNDKSELRLVKDSSNHSGMYPDSEGVLFIRKTDDNNVELRFLGTDSTGEISEWISYYNDSKTPKYTGWVEVTHSDNIREAINNAQYIIILPSSAVGSKYPDGFSSFNLTADTTSGFPYNDGTVLNYKDDMGNIKQVITNINSGEIKHRNWISATNNWTDWVNVWDSYNLDPNSFETPSGAASKINTHAQKTKDVHGSTSSAVINSIMQRDSNGNSKVASPTEADHIARKDTVDNAMAMAAKLNGENKFTAPQIIKDFIRFENVENRAYMQAGSNELDGNASMIFSRRNTNNGQMASFDIFAAIARWNNDRIVVTNQGNGSKLWVSPSNPSGGNDGDIWFQY